MRFLEVAVGGVWVDKEGRRRRNREMGKSGREMGKSGREGDEK